MTEEILCIICQKPYATGETFTLTDAEKKAIGDSAPDEVNYCSACLKVMQDREAGAQLLKGLYEMHLRAAGVPPINIRSVSKRFYEILKQDKEKLH